MRKYVLLKINVIFLLLLIYLLFSIFYEVKVTNTDKGILAYNIKLNDKEIKSSDMTFNEFIYNNIDSLNVPLTIWSYPYFYTNDKNIQEEFLSRVKSDVQDPILLGDYIYYTNNFTDIYLYDGIAYNIGGVFEQTVIPMEYVPKNKLFEINQAYFITDKDSINEVIDILNNSGFDVEYDETYIGGGGSYNLTYIKTLISYMQYNAILILVVLLSTYMLMLSKKKENIKLQNILFLYGTSMKKSFYIYFNKYINIFVTSFIIFTLFLLLLDYLSRHYIFLTKITFNLLPIIYTVIVSLIFIFLLSFINVIRYVKRRKYE